MLSALVVVAACLARCRLHEGTRHSSERQAITPAKYDEGVLAKSHNAATGERVFHNIGLENSESQLLVSLSLFVIFFRCTDYHSRCICHSIQVNRTRLFQWQGHMLRLFIDSSSRGRLQPNRAVKAAAVKAVVSV